MESTERPLNLEAEPVANKFSQPTDAERRAALRRLGPMAILTPPVVMSLLVSKRASAASLVQP